MVGTERLTGAYDCRSIVGVAETVQTDRAAAKPASTAPQDLAVHLHRKAVVDSRQSKSKEVVGQPFPNEPGLIHTAAMPSRSIVTGRANAA